MNKDQELNRRIANNEDTVEYVIDNFKIIATKVIGVSSHEDVYYYETEDLQSVYTSEFIFLTLEDAKSALIRKCEETIKKYKGE